MSAILKRACAQIYPSELIEAEELLLTAEHEYLRQKRDHLLFIIECAQDEVSDRFSSQGATLGVDEDGSWRGHHE